jgi:hypothetical protein
VTESEPTILEPTGGEIYEKRHAGLIIIHLHSIQFFIIYVTSQQLQGQLQTQKSVDTGNHIKDKNNIKTRDKLQASTGERKHINTEKVNKQRRKMKRNT